MILSSSLRYLLIVLFIINLVGFWIISALWGVLCALPHYIGATSTADGSHSAVSLGSAMYVVGLVVETLADYQKWQFKSKNPGKFCDVGLVSLMCVYLVFFLAKFEI